jgi:hypothetical protein
VRELGGLGGGRHGASGMSAMPGREPNESEQYNNQVDKGIEIRHFIDNGLAKSGTNSHWDDVHGGDDQTGNDFIRGDYVSEADKLNRKNPNLDATLATEDNHKDEDENGKITPKSKAQAPDFMAKTFIDEIKRVNNKIVSGTIVIWLDPAVSQGGDIIPAGKLPAALQGNSGGLDVKVTANLVKDFNRIVKVFTDNKVKFGDGTNGTVKLEVWVAPRTATYQTSSQGPRVKQSSKLERYNVIIWKKPSPPPTPTAIKRV